VTTLLPPTLIRYAGPPTVPGYSIGEFLGRGTTGIVWAAQSQETGKRVALKVIEPDGVEGVDPDVAEREEALGRRVAGAHLVTVRGRVGLEDGRVALVMNLADGGSLQDVVTIRGALPLGEVVTALTPLATALAELHEVGVVHADVAPANVLFTLDGRPMLADLSSAWLAEDGWPMRCRGTPGFTAPEVAHVQPPVWASDVWSLGALAWYARTGGLTPPRWVGDLHWFGAVGDDDDPDEDDERGTVADVVAAVGPELAPLLIRMLAEEPDVRPSAAEVALALYRAAAPEPVGLVGRHPDPAAAVTTRIRRDAAETRSRSELRALHRDEERRARRGVRRRRVRGLLRPWDRGREPPPGGGRAWSWRARLAVVALLGALLASGMFGLLVLTGGSLELPFRPVAETSTDAGADASGAAGGVHSEPTDRGVTGSASDRALGDGTAEASATVGSATASPAAGVPAQVAEGAASVVVTGTCSGTGDASGAPASRSSIDKVTCDPVSVLQDLADRRAAALVAADPVLLVGAEPAGSSAYDSDVRTITRLREQRQRYIELAFTVRSAQVLSTTPATVVVNAVVDRSAYEVANDSGETQPVSAAPGSPLRYTLCSADGAWRLTEVGPL
jgi:eukaryotic-like serine/threonine-protein kinase